MKNPAMAMIGLLALGACGDDASVTKGAGERSVEAPVTPPAAVEQVAEVAATPEPEPIDAVIAFRGEDGELALPREALTMISPVHDSDRDAWSVFIQLEETAAETFYTLTTKTTGEALAVIVDDMVVSAPILDTPVYGGGFVFPVDDGDAASIVVAALKGEEVAQPMIRAVAADEALPGDDDADAETVASASNEPE